MVTVKLDMSDLKTKEAVDSWDPNTVYVLRMGNGPTKAMGTVEDELTVQAQASDSALPSEEEETEEDTAEDAVESTAKPSAPGPAAVTKALGG